MPNIQSSITLAPCNLFIFSSQSCCFKFQLRVLSDSEYQMFLALLQFYGCAPITHIGISLKCFFSVTEVRVFQAFGEQTACPNVGSNEDNVTRLEQHVLGIWQAWEHPKSHVEDGDRSQNLISLVNLLQPSTHF